MPYRSRASPHAARAQPWPVSMQHWGSLSRDHSQKAEVQYSRVSRNIVISLFRLREGLFCSRMYVIRGWDVLSFVSFWRCVWQWLASRQPVLCWKLQQVCSAAQNSLGNTALKDSIFPLSSGESKVMSGTDNEQQWWKMWLHPQRTVDSWPESWGQILSMKFVVCERPVKISIGSAMLMTLWVVRHFACWYIYFTCVYICMHACMLVCACTSYILEKYSFPLQAQECLVVWVPVQAEVCNEGPSLVDFGYWRIWIFLS